MTYEKLIRTMSPIEIAVRDLAKVTKLYGPLNEKSDKDLEDKNLLDELSARRESLARGIAAMTPIGWDDAEARIRALHLIVLDEFHYDEDSIVAPLIAAIARDLEFFSLPTKSAAA